jgi:hypothetical protein
MEQIPTAREAIGLQELAHMLRASAADTGNQDYIGLFLNAALALEARARSATPLPYDFKERRHVYRA